jgi:hypothetical protein
MRSASKTPQLKRNENSPKFFLFVAAVAPVAVPSKLRVSGQGRVEI